MRKLVLKLGLCFCTVIAAAGCRPPAATGTLYQLLLNDDPSVRIEAIVQAGSDKDQQAVPNLIESLSSDDGSVRMYAYLALQKITGMTMGYEYYASKPDREQAIERWREWLKSGRTVVPAATSGRARATSSPIASGLEQPA